MSIIGSVVGNGNRIGGITMASLTAGGAVRFVSNGVDVTDRVPAQRDGEKRKIQLVVDGNVIQQYNEGEGI